MNFVSWPVAMLAIASFSAGAAENIDAKPDVAKASTPPAW